MSNYGALSEADISVLEAALEAAALLGRIRFLEIGVHTGQTARGIREWCMSKNVALEYWGLDSGVQNDGEPPFEGATMVRGDSAESFHLVPDVFDIVLLDGCHCLNHVILDTYHYSPKVRPGGFLLFHDTSPEIQQTMHDPHGPDIPEFRNSVNAALEMIRWPWRGWALWRSEYQKGLSFGGTRAYRRTE